MAITYSRITNTMPSTKRRNKHVQGTHLVLIRTNVTEIGFNHREPEAAEFPLGNLYSLFYIGGSTDKLTSRVRRFLLHSFGDTQVLYTFINIIPVPIS
jgi:hypothetical protein